MKRLITTLIIGIIFVGCGKTKNNLLAQSTITLQPSGTVQISVKESKSIYAFEGATNVPYANLFWKLTIVESWDNTPGGQVTLTEVAGQTGVVSFASNRAGLFELTAKDKGQPSITATLKISVGQKPITPPCPPTCGSISPPTLYSPPSGAQLGPDRPISFSWSAVTGAASYVFSLYGPNGLVNQQTTSTTSVSVFTTFFTPGTNYTWNVIAKNVAGQPSSPSTTFSFKTTGGPLAGQTAFLTRFVAKNNQDLVLNMTTYPRYDFAWLYTRVNGDTEQIFEAYQPGTSGSPKWMFKRQGLNACMNAYNPFHGADDIFAYDPCNIGDPEMNWDIHYHTDYDAYFIITQGYCLTAPNLFLNGRVILRSCNTNDTQQHWKLEFLTNPPLPNWQVSTGTITASATEGDTPASQTLNVANTGMMTQNNSLIGGTASFQVNNPNSWFNVSPMSGSLPRGVNQNNPNQNLTINFTPCTAVGNTSGNFAISGSGGNTTTVYVTKVCNTLPKPNWQVNPSSISFAPSDVGGSTAISSFIVSNTGTESGTFSVISSNPSVVSTSLSDSNPVSPGEGKTVTVSVNPCTSVGTQQATLTISGSGSPSSPTVSISRVCEAAKNPDWRVNGVASYNLILPSGVVGGTTTSQTVSVSNVGTGTGNFSVTSSNPSVIGVGVVDANPVTPGGSKTVTVSAIACSSVGTQSATLTISGGGSTTSPTVTVSRTCTTTPPTPPNTPTNLSLTMSSGGRIMAVWQEVVNADQYEFRGSFDGNPITFSSAVTANSGNSMSGAVFAWDSNPSDPAKQDKQLCISTRAVNGGGSSGYSSSVCTSYRYFTLSTPPAVMNVQQINISQ